METVTVVTTTKGKDGKPLKTTHEVEPGPGGFSVIVHQQGIKVDVPAFVEIDCRLTLETIQKLTQSQWEWISTGETFRVLFHLAFDPCDRYAPPESVDELKDMDYGIQHVAGMIIMASEAMFMGRSVFFRNPENFLHPKTERYIVSMFKAMLYMCGRSGVVTAEKEERGRPASDVKRKKTPRKNAEDDFGDDEEVTPEEMEKQFASEKRDIEDALKEIRKRDKTKARKTPKSEKDITLEMLKNRVKEKGEDHPFAAIGEQKLTIREVLKHVAEETEIGKQVIKLYMDRFQPQAGA